MYWLQKLFSLLVTLLLVTIVTFLFLYLIPGDPAALILGTEADPEALLLLRQQLGLDQPIVVQYGNWLQGVLKGDLGKSLTLSRGYPVARLIADALPVTIPLALAAVGLSLVIAVGLGALAASRQGSKTDAVVQYFSQVGLSVPSFWLGIMLIQLFAVRWDLLPPSGMPRWSSNPGGALLALLLPTLTLALPRAAILTRVVRSAMIDVLQEDYIRTARSKGLPERVVVYQHALRNTLVNVSTVAGIQLIQLIAGTIVVEQVFSLPGLGRLTLSAVLLRDLPLVQGTVFVGAALILCINFALDCLYPWLDPRVKS